MGSIGQTRADGLPVANPTTSYWQAEARDSTLHDHGRDAALPEQVVDVCIVGSGISGAVAAYMLQRDGQGPESAEQRGSSTTASSVGHTPSIVIVEARQACSGATGRNGGHCRPDTFAGFANYAEIVGEEQADAVLQNEWDTYMLMDSIVHAEQLDCDWWSGRTLGVYRSERIKQKAKATFERYQSYRAGAGLKPGIRFIDDPQTAQRMSRVHDAVGAATWPAASLHPLRFVHGVLQRCMRHSNFQLFTHTPVKGLSKGREASGEGDVWRVQTTRGTVRARRVLLATNGYSSTLLPSLQDFVLPHRAQCSAIDPPDNFVKAMALNATMSIINGDSGDYDYLTQQPSLGGPNAPQQRNDRRGTGAFILGGGRPYASLAEQIDTLDDSQLVDAISEHLEDYPRKTFTDWQPKSGRLIHVWTGIQGYTRDSLPLVGESFDQMQKGLFLCLGHHGHGMARAATCARGVARLILEDQRGEQGAGEIDDAAWARAAMLPSSYRWTSKRSVRTDVDCRADS